ncbi:hypothetical protein CDAR_589491 [Caerostris darwini]|uniref:Uncharacterized protein n=1 Tax=Caerostris darwini TaxID=1538125 RepID=A0AAV4TZ55_9ARAC|nr:hypothetical protein CDAR_589491 [Caerostris darwini]
MEVSNIRSSPKKSLSVSLRQLLPLSNSETGHQLIVNTLGRIQDMTDRGLQSSIILLAALDFSQLPQSSHDPGDGPRNVQN